MDIWQSADPAGTVKTGWLGRATARGDNPSGGVPILHLGSGRLPLALNGAPGAARSPSTTRTRSASSWAEARPPSSRPAAGCSGELAATTEDAEADDLASFVRRRQVQTLTAVETLRELLEGPGAVARRGGGLSERLQLVAGLIARGFGTRIFYVSLDGFDTHANQGPAHGNLLGDLANSVTQFFQTLKTTGNDRRVRLLTFSEFGRRVEENGSRGTDHGAASCLFLAGPSVKGGVVGHAPQPGRPRRRRPEVPHRLPPRLRDPARRLAGLRQQGRAGREVGPRQGARNQGLSEDEEPTSAGLPGPGPTPDLPAPRNIFRKSRKIYLEGSPATCGARSGRFPDRCIQEIAELRHPDR